MDPFMKSDQYHFLKHQAKLLASAYGSVNDASVLEALTSLAREKAVGLFEQLTSEQKLLLEPISAVKDREGADAFTASLKAYVIPFPDLTEQALKKAFPKVKKLKVPPLEEVDFKETSYVRWHDAGANKTYIVFEKDGRLAGVRGLMKNEGIKGICSICNGHEDIALFMSESKKTVQGTSVKRGNYICKSSLVCNENIQSREKLIEWMARLTQ